MTENLSVRETGQDGVIRTPLCNFRWYGDVLQQQWIDIADGLVWQDIPRVEVREEEGAEVSE